MKVAVFHDYLNQFGGAERVLQSILEIFPDADLYTLLYDKEKTFGFFDKHIKKTSFLDKPIVRGKHRAFIPLMPLASRAVTLEETYDLIFSSSAGYAKGFGGNHGNFHISYCHSPLRYAWEFEYLRNLPFSPWPLTQFFVEPIARRLRKWDWNAAQKVNIFIANSRFIANKINSYYGRDAYVVYPPVDTDVFYFEDAGGEDYYLMTGRLLYYKLFDLGIEAFNILKKPLKIIGSGPEALKLRKIAGPNIEFIPYVTDKELRRLYSNAQAFIFPQVEDFGLVAAEAQACGLPIIGFNGGGVREIIENGKTGLLFQNQRVEDLVSAVREFEEFSLDRSYIAERAKMFSKKKFKEGIVEVVKKSGFSETAHEAC